MDRNYCSFTVMFQPPFWVGIAERWDGGWYSAVRVVFGAEPTDAQLYEWLEREWHRLNFSPAVEGERLAVHRKNPKRAMREAREATRTKGISTRAQEVLSRQREQEGLARRREVKRCVEQARQEKYFLRQQKNRYKNRGR